MNDKVIKETLLNQKVEPELFYFFETANIEEIKEYWELFNNKNKKQWYLQQVLIYQVN